uniref:Histone-lysine N-methyltransferase SETMAR n=1 Tax=Magallana gigas TaxID=29159 RepID=A0A8W8LK59_MAGGI|nr:probable histone-lysine N-methyltransferase set-23 [Crassostrea gigas]
MNAQSPCSFDWTDGLEKFPVYCRKEDGVQGKDSMFQYVKHNIPGPGIDKEKFLPVFIGCSCHECISDCPCVQRFGQNYTEDGKLKTSYLDADEHKVMVECNGNCSCSQTCVNRVVQGGVKVRVELFWTVSKGIGVRTLEDLDPGAFVCEYAGEIISSDEARKRSLAQRKEDMNYIITVNEHCKSGVIKTHVDPRNFGNVGRFLNHSCDPNLTMLPVRIDSEIPLLCLFAKRKISSGEELNFHYGLSSGDERTVYSDIDGKESGLIPCNCGSQLCQGYLPFDKTLFDD